MRYPKAAYITEHLPDTKELFPSQYGQVTNWKWLIMEEARIPNSRIEIEPEGMALVDTKAARDIKRKKKQNETA